MLNILYNTKSPRCNSSKCFAYWDGKCSVLVSSNIKGSCPFFKDKEAKAAEDLRCKDTVSRRQKKHGGRNAINCLTDIIGMNFKSAVEALSGANMTYMDCRKAVPKLPQAKKLVLPERADNMRKVFAYLCQTRQLESKLGSELAHDGLLYQDKRGNAVFLHKDENGNSIGAEIQGTNSEKRYKGVALGTSDSLFSVTLGIPTKAYIFESAIDLLSFRQLANQQKIQNSVLVSMAGLKPNSLKKLSDRGLQLFACVDNNEVGRKFISGNNLTRRNHILKEFGVKDFNELLVKITKLQQKTEKRPLNRKHARH